MIYELEIGITPLTYFRYKLAEDCRRIVENEDESDDEDESESDDEDEEEIKKDERMIMNLKVNENLHLLCEHDGAECEFSIKPSIYSIILYIMQIDLPDGIRIDSSTGTIEGKSPISFGKTRYRITCRTATNDKTFILILVIGKLTQFTYYPKSVKPKVNEEMKLIPDFDGDDCRFSVEPGIYIYKFHLYW